MTTYTTWIYPQQDIAYVVCESADGWSLHAPGSTDDEIARGDAPALVSGAWNETQTIPPEAFLTAHNQLNNNGENP